jgi:hypothetical protein
MASPWGVWKEFGFLRPGFEIDSGFYVICIFFPNASLRVDLKRVRLWLHRSD